MNIPVAPVLIFFYQMFIRMWFRDYRPSDIGYMAVENQIYLGLISSCMTTVLWTIAYYPGLIPEDKGVTIDLSENRKAKDGTYGYAAGGDRTIYVTKYDEPKNFCRYTHKVSNGGEQQFTLEKVLDDRNTPLVLYSCIQGKVNEVPEYCEKDQNKAKEPPLLICTRFSSSH